MESVLILCQLIALCVCCVKSQQETFAKWKQNLDHWINSDLVLRPVVRPFLRGLSLKPPLTLLGLGLGLGLGHNGLNGILKIRQVGPVALPILLHILI